MASETEVGGVQVGKQEHSLEMLFRQFSCPQEFRSEITAQTIAVTYGRELVRLFLMRYGEMLNKRSTGLVELMEGWLEADADLETVWDIAFGGLYRSLSSGSPDPVSIAAGFGLRVGTAGMTGEWTASLGKPARLRWDRFLLPAAQDIAVRSGSGAASIDFGSRGYFQTATFTRVEAGWQGEGAELLVGVGDRRRLTLLPRYALDEKFPEEDHDAAVEAIDQTVVRAFEEAVETLAQHASDYLWWVERGVNNVLVLRTQASTLRSGSSSDWPRLIYASVSQPIAIAETLVHEGTHQYFHLLSKVGPVDDGTDKRMYYSPAVGRERPLSRILIAYHAFANVSLWYTRCLASGVKDGGYCAMNQRKLLSQLKTLEAPLSGNKALTTIGRALYEPLRDRLHASRL